VAIWYILWLFGIFFLFWYVVPLKLWQPWFWLRDRVARYFLGTTCHKEKIYTKWPQNVLYGNKIYHLTAICIYQMAITYVTAGFWIQFRSELTSSEFQIDLRTGTTHVHNVMIWDIFWP
jgi:hypothetical protein